MKFRLHPFYALLDIQVKFLIVTRSHQTVMSVYEVSVS